MFRVRLELFDGVYQAATAAGARYQMFKNLREAGYFIGRGGFHAFLSSRPRVRELRA